jgi:hypothetical protein
VNIAISKVLSIKSILSLVISILHSTSALDILFTLNKNTFPVGIQSNYDIGVDKQRGDTTKNVPIFSVSTPSNPTFLHLTSPSAFTSRREAI